MQDLRRNSPDTIEGLKQENYEVVFYVKHENQTDAFEERGFKFFHCYERKEISCSFRALQQGKFMIDFGRLPITRTKKVELILEGYASPGTLPFTFKYSTDDFITINRGITMVKNDIYWKPFHDMLQRLFEAGITKYKSYSQNLDEFFRAFKIYDKKNHDNVVLSLHLLSAGFYVYISCIAISCFVFIVEVSLHFVKKRREAAASLVRPFTN